MSLQDFIKECQENVFSGVGITSKDAAKLLSEVFREKKIKKTYIAVVRGFTEDEDRIDYALQEDKTSPLKDAVTVYKRLQIVEFDNPVGRYKTSRFSLVEVVPETGRFHQIRKHLAHIFHPILNDSVHGDGKQNRFIREKFDINRLLLASTSLKFEHPFQKKIITIKAPVAFDMQQVIDKMFV